MPHCQELQVSAWALDDFDLSQVELGVVFKANVDMNGMANINAKESTWLLMDLGTSSLVNVRADLRYQITESDSTIFITKYQNPSREWFGHC
jgi:hypothetical protein